MIIKELEIVKNKNKVVGLDENYNEYRLFGDINKNINIGTNILVFGYIELIDGILGIDVVEYMHFLKDMVSDQVSYFMSISGISIDIANKMNKLNKSLVVSIMLGNSTDYELSNNTIPIEVIRKIRKYTENQYNINNIYNIGYEELGLPIDLLIKYHKNGGVIDEIKENPFIIARSMNDINSIKNNIKIDDVKILNNKIISGITNFTITNHIENENISISKDKLRDTVYELYPVEQFDTIFNYVLTYFKEYGLIKIIDNYVYTVNSLELENRIIKNLSNRINSNKSQINIDNNGLMSEQYEALLNLLNNSVSVITGGPGTGKTYFIGKILEILKDNKIEMIAPTGKAARKISEYTGVKSSTIHEKYRIIDGESYGKVNDIDLLIIDEASMISLDILDIILSNTSIDVNILFIGDVNQLPPVGVGSALVDLISINNIPVVEFKNIYRQDKDSNIIKNAYNILDNKIDLVSKNGIDNDFFIMESINSEQQLLMIEALTNSLVNDHKYSMSDIQVLCPTNIGPSGTNSVNRLLVGNNKSISVGNKVIQTVNNKNKMVMNGEIGYIKSINITNNNKVVIVKFNDKDVEYINDEIDELDLAYAISIHKSQGSEFSIVIIPIYKSMSDDKLKQLLYTGITRAKDKVVLISNRELLNKVIMSDIVLNKSNIPNKINKKRERVQ